MILFYHRRALALSFSSYKTSFLHQRRGAIQPITPLISRSSCRSAASISDIHTGGEETSSHHSDQDAYMDQMKDWRGTSHSTSEFVTHFIASNNNITIEDAISSVLPKGIDHSKDAESIERRDELMQRDNDKVLSRLEMKFRYDPSQFPLHQQLNPVDLIAMGSIWFLPADAPRDPGEFVYVKYFLQNFYHVPFSFSDSFIIIPSTWFKASSPRG